MNWITFKNWLSEHGYDSSEQTINNFSTYLDLLKEWNEKFNLTSVSDIEEAIEIHLVDSLLFPFKDMDGKTLLDLGSGAGLPGIPLKIAYPNLKVVLLEPTTKKCSFLTEVISRLNLQEIEVANLRAEEYVVDHRESFDYVVSRAVGLLNPLLELSIPLVKLNGRCMAYKGKKGLEELEKATGALKKLKAQHLLTLTESLPTKHEERILLVFGKLAPSPKDFPRHYSMIKSRPL